VPSSKYGNFLELMEITGWDWWTLRQQPADLVDEMIVKLGARNRIQAEMTARNEAKAGAHAKRR
jgi:hypothetical protein